MIRKLWPALALILATTLPAPAAEDYPYANESKDARDARMAWWREAKFGMFIHWGVYAVPAGTYKDKRIGGIGEWIMRNAEIPVAEYKEYARRFNPVKYQPAEWARLAKDAGMRYMIITSKHHDGFALFPTGASRWNVVDSTPYGKDLIGPLAAAARAEGLKFGLYYSQAQDWTNPGGAKARLKEGEGWDEAHKGSFDKYLDEVAVPQTREILTKYQPDVLWWDTPHLMTRERAAKLAPLLALKPGIIHNNRLGGGYSGDTDTPEQHIPATGMPGRDWETCMTMNDTWGFKSYDHNWKPVKVLLRNLVDIVSKGGNYLLNVGPTAEGEIPPESIERLRQVGAWMKKNGTAIHGTTASPFPKLPWGRCTVKTASDKSTTTLYLHVFDWPKDGKLSVPGLVNKPLSASLLENGTKIPCSGGDTGVTLTVPAETPDPLVAVIALQVEGEPKVATTLVEPAADGTITLEANTANTTGGMKFEPDKNCLGFWLKPADRASWDVRVPASGSYTVEAEVAAQADSAIRLTCGKSESRAKVNSTGAYETFQSLAFDPPLELAAGRQTLTLADATKDWQPVNVRKITLRPARAAESPAAKDARMAWFREARFGLFIHWGLYSVPAGEWNGNKNLGEWFLEETKMPVSQYEKFVAQFNPVKFDAKAWVRMAKDAGMKYLVITSKHHDGFGLWRSDATDWCIKSTPFQRDPLKELAAACREQGIKFCLYHSIMDWHHPDWGTRRAYNDKAPATPPDMDRYVAYMKSQLKELVTGYGPLGILWFDGEWESPWTHERGLDLYQFVRGLQPDIIINNRVGKGRSGMQGMDKGRGVGDYGTPEQEIPPTGFGPGVDWESCMTMNNHWGYNRHDQNWKPTPVLIRHLVDCASKGGNYLLNIGPTAEGEFPQASVERLRDIGAWMKKYGVSVHGTTASPFRQLPWGRCTVKASDNNTTRLFLHVFDWPQNGKLLVPGLKNQTLAASLLENSAALTFNATADGVVIEVPEKAPDSADTVIELKINGTPQVAP